MKWIDGLTVRENSDLQPVHSDHIRRGRSTRSARTEGRLELLVGVWDQYSDRQTAKNKERRETVEHRIECAGHDLPWILSLARCHGDVVWSKAPPLSEIHFVSVRGHRLNVWLTLL